MLDNQTMIDKTIFQLQRTLFLLSDLIWQQAPSTHHFQKLAIPRLAQRFTSVIYGNMDKV